MNNEYFIYGNKKVPAWVTEGFRRGILIESIDEENNKRTLKVVTSTKTYELNVGDVLVNGKHGLVGLSKEKAKHIIGVKKEDEENE